MNSKSRIRFLALLLACLSGADAQNVFIVVIDGARYSETFALKDKYIPRIWNDLRPHGTIFTNFRNDGKTVTCPGHAAFLTGAYEDLENDGSERPHVPTLFEYYRAKTGAGDTCCYAVTGKEKLRVLTYSTDGMFGEKFGARFTAPGSMSDTATWTDLKRVMDADHPRLVIVNLPSVDIAGHDSAWTGYLLALREVDSLVYLLWNRIQSDSFYRDRTTMFVSSDHGRHDDAHGGFQHHGCSCEGCRHIIGLGIGPGFRKGAVVDGCVGQTDVRAAAAELLSIPLPISDAKKILNAGR
ncbi:MAG TPA: alkaline phosphatase [Bacteroidota bacterium]|nr:alkaline phosphatase [Bacteroidota bacterium]